MGILPNLTNLKEKFKKRGKYYEIIEIPLEKEYKILILKDITERVSLKEAYQIVLSYLSHELKTPIAIASGYLERLGNFLEEEKIDEKTRKIYEKVTLAFKNLEKLLKKLFSSIEYLAKDIKIAKEPFSLKEAIEEAIFWVSPLSEKKGYLY
ncbi:MAG: histidine kinase dimerization/phospho-acceptor domain-containing protein [Caldimicrobium sp.]